MSDCDKNSALKNEIVSILNCNVMTSFYFVASCFIKQKPY